MALAYDTFEQACAVVRLLVERNGFRYRIRKNELGYWQIDRAGRGRGK